MESYDSMLNHAYSKIKIVSASADRFEVPKAVGQVAGQSTIITNLAAIASYIRRPIEHLAKYLQKELAMPGTLEGERLSLKGRLNSAKVNEKISNYVQEFVLCPECKKPDTEIISEKGIKFKHCLACGAKTPIRSRS